MRSKLIATLGILVCACSIHASDEPDDHNDVKIETETVATSPKDRKRKKIGICEEVTLKADIDVEWKIEKGDGKLSSDNGKTVTFTAPDEASDKNGVEITITAIAKKSGKSDSVTFNVVEPNGVLLEKRKEPKPATQKEPLGVIYLADIYITPSDVNFEQINYFEGEAKPEVDGYFDLKDYRDMVHEITDQAMPLINHVEHKGTMGIIPDYLRIVTHGKPYKNGFFRWRIPWYYTTGPTEKKFTTMVHLVTMNVDKNGVAKIVMSKGASEHDETNP